MKQSMYMQNHITSANTIRTMHGLKCKRTRESYKGYNWSLLCNFSIYRQTI